jgi:hypothetical protein
MKICFSRLRSQVRKTRFFIILCFQNFWDSLHGLSLTSCFAAVFHEPFKPLFFCYDRIVELYQNTKEGLLRQHLGLLVQVMDELFGGFMKQLKNLRASGLISYKLAWTYFPKDTMIFSAAKDCERVCRVLATSYQCQPPMPPHLLINCQEISFDGETFAWKPFTLQIPAFGGNLPVTELPNYPLSFHEDEEGLVERLTVRAKKVLEYQDLTYCEYSGIGLLKGPCGVEKHNVCEFLSRSPFKADQRSQVIFKAQDEMSDVKI